MIRVVPAGPFRRVSARASTGAFAAALVIFVAGFWVGFDALHTGAGDAAAGAVVQGSTVAMTTILGRNLGAAALLYSGVATAGVSTGIGLLLVAGFVGATFGSATDNVGVAEVLASISWYAPLELGGLLMCATAGLLPVVGALRGDGSASRIHIYRRSLASSLGVAGCGVAVITAAAAVEALVISSR